MKKRILLGLIFLSTGAAASNACLIDGRTVFQKEPCPIQEAKNLTDDIKTFRENKLSEQEAIASDEKANKEELEEKLRISEQEYRNSPEGKAESRAKRMEALLLHNSALIMQQRRR